MPIQCLPSGKSLNELAQIDLNTTEYNIAYLAHYITKTWEEFKKQKLNRTDAALSRIISINYFKEINKNTKIKED